MQATETLHDYLKIRFDDSVILVYQIAKPNNDMKITHQTTMILYIIPLIKFTR